MVQKSARCREYLEYTVQFGLKYTRFKWQKYLSTNIYNLDL